MSNEQPAAGQPQRFRKKPVTIDAVQFIPQDDDPDDLRVGPTTRALDAIGAPVEDWRFAPDAIVIPTLEGTMTASPGDWIIKGVKGEFYPCKDDIFRATYEPAASRPEPGEPVVWFVVATTEYNRTVPHEIYDDKGDAEHEAYDDSDAVLIPVVAKADYDRVENALGQSKVAREMADARIHELQQQLSAMRAAKEQAVAEAAAFRLAANKAHSAIVEYMIDGTPDETLANERWKAALKKIADGGIVPDIDAKDGESEPSEIPREALQESEE